jgi:hypothetical protein
MTQLLGRKPSASSIKPGTAAKVICPFTQIGGESPGSSSPALFGSTPSPAGADHRLDGRPSRARIRPIRLLTGFATLKHAHSLAAHNAQSEPGRWC